MLSTSFLWALDPPSLTQNKQRRVRFPLMEICDAPILGITEDTDGKLWFASWGEGLYWYDGIHKGRFTYEDGLTGQFLRDCQFGPNGNLWITVDNSLMQRVGDRFLVRSDELEDVPKDFFWMELDSKGNLYVGAKDGIVAADPQGGLVYHSLGQIFPASSYVYCLFADESRGILWTGWANGFLVALDLKSFKPLSEVPPEDLSRYGSILDLTLDTEGDLWVAAEENTLVRQGDSWKEIRPQEIKEVWRCQSLCPHSKGRMLMGLALGMGDYDQGKLTIFDHNRQLSQDRVYSVYASRSDTIWLGTQSGVTCLMPPYFEREDIPISTNRLMDTDLDREGRLWVGGDGLCYRQGGVWSRVEVGDIPSKSYLSKITITPEGRVLTVWNYAGVYIWENGEGRWLPAPPHPDQAFSAVIETSDGMIWVGTYEEGVIGWNGQEWIPMPGGDREFQGQGQLDGRSVHSFCESRDGSLWIGSTGSEESLFRYSNGELELIRGPIDLTFPEIEEMIEEPDGTLVMATNGGGVLEYHNGQWAVHNRETQGFLTNRFISLEYSESEGLWAGTRSDGLYHYKNGVWTHFSGDDGLFKCRVDGLSWDENGDLFLATHLEGFLRLIRDTRPPDTFITSTPDKVIKGENVVLAVKGADPWMETQPDRLSFLWSLNQGPWRVNPGGQTLSVPIDRVGDHEIRVASVDINGNVDPIPAVAHFQAAYHWSNHPATIVVFFTSLIILGWSVIFFSVRYKYLKEAHQADLKYREKLE
ncbi:MAG: hypothetical protein KC944_05815, partial [Candidatus Omnitrophica bacterium]|nr:hypothetical protein [Candidatus Omnitrophota bacterium]